MRGFRTSRLRPPGCSVRPEVLTYGGAALAVLAALVVGTAGADAVHLALGMMLVAVAVILVVVGTVRLRRQERGRTTGAGADG